MDVLPLNEKLLMMEGDDEAWVDTHHGLGEGRSGESTSALGLTRSTDFLPPSVVEQTAERLVEMTMEAADKKTQPAVASTEPTPLVGTAIEQDSDSDSEPAVDIDEYQVEDDDPVSEWGGGRRVMANLACLPHPGCPPPAGCGRALCQAGGGPYPEDSDIRPEHHL